MRYVKGGIFIKKKILTTIVVLSVFSLLTVNAFAAAKSITKDFPKIYSEQEYNEVIKDLSDDPLYNDKKIAPPKSFRTDSILYRREILPIPPMRI